MECLRATYKGYDVNEKFQRSAITCLTTIGQQARMEGKLKVLINMANDKGYTPIYVAANVGDNELVQYLIDNGAKVDSATFNQDVTPGDTALIGACQDGHLQTIQMLLNAGADINKQRRDGVDCVYWAVHRNQVEIIEEVLKRKPELAKRQSFNGQTILHLASAKGYVEAVETILANGIVDINMEDGKFGQTSLEHAAIGGSLPVVKVLVNSHANIHHVVRGKTALQLAEDRGHTDIVQYLNNL